MSNAERVLRDFEALPPEGQREVIDFVAFLRGRYSADQKKRSPKPGQLQSERFVGMWADREDLRDSSAWVRNLRLGEWGG